MINKTYFPSVILINGKPFNRSGYSIDFETGIKRDRAIYIQEGGKKHHYLSLEKLNENLENGTMKLKN